MTEKTLPVHEVAKRLRCSIRHVQRLVDAGVLEAVRDQRGREGISEASLVEYENARAAATDRWTESTRELDDLGAPTV